MITITADAQEKLTTYLTENKVQPRVRVYLPACGCSGGGDQLALTLDEPSDNDITITAGALELFMDKSLSEQLGKVSIRFKDDGRDSGFVVDSEKSIPAQDGGGCGSGCSGCG